jgi:hypothetical protein
MRSLHSAAVSKIDLMASARYSLLQVWRSPALHVALTATRE